MKKINITPSELLTKTIYLKQSSSIVTKFVAKLLLLAVGLLTITSIGHAQKFNGKFLNNTNADGVILDGYDPVAFFMDNKPVKGDPQFSFTYEDATYHLTSSLKIEAM